MRRGRPCKKRFIDFSPHIKIFKPAGVKGDSLETVFLRIDELEAMRHVDFEGLYQQEAADLMKVSRTTLARMLESGRKKLLETIIHSKRLVIEEDINIEQSIDNNSN